MQTPISPELIRGGRYEDGRVIFAPSVAPLSVESQLKLRALYEYMETSRTALNDVRKNLSLLKMYPECSEYSKKACEQLGRLCAEADSWGFDPFYQISMNMQMLLLDSSQGYQQEAFWNALNRGWSMLWDLLEQCDSDFRWRLAVADTLDCLKRVREC